MLIDIVEDVDSYKREKLYRDYEWDVHTLLRIEGHLSHVDLCESVENVKVYERFVEIAEEYILTLSDEGKEARRKGMERYRAQVVADTYRALERIFGIKLLEADRKKILNVVCKIYVKYSESFPLLEPSKNPLHLLF
ncbi:MAG: hypothetical protein U9P90_04055 [Patescibacteria group bacterium]|nr:hypothetical protein [Patescibacteria group bacterium]